MTRLLKIGIASGIGLFASLAAYNTKSDLNSFSIIRFGRAAKTVIIITFVAFFN